MNPEPSRDELLHRIAELEARVAGYETGAEQASRESDGRLRLFMEHVPASIAMFDRDMRYMAFSRRWSVEYVGGAEGLVGQSHYEIFPECPERWRAAHRRGMAGEIVRVEKDVWQRADGSESWTRYEVRPWRAANGDVGGITILVEDIAYHKQTLEALRRSERIYRAIGESTDYGVWVCEPDGRNTYVSDSFLKLVGLSQEQCSNFGWATALHPNDADRTIAAWKECVRTEGRWDMEHRFRGVDGDWHPVLSRGVPVRDELGQIACWAGINLDISALKRTEESLRAREAQARATVAELQTIMDAAPAAIVIAHDVEGRQVGGNRMANELVRQPPHSNLSRSAAVDQPGNFRLMRDGVEFPAPERPLRKVAASGQALRNYEMQVVLEDGTSIDMLGNIEPLLDDNGRPRGAVAVLSDITERKRAEAVLREREQQLVSIYNTVQDFIFYLAVEPEGRFRFVSVNETFLRVTGLSLDAVVGRTVNEVVPEPTLTMVLEKFRQAVERKAIVSWEDTSDYATGRLTGEVTVAPVFDNTGACTHLVGSVHDISERKHAESALRQSGERFQTVADTAPVMIWMAGLDKLSIFVNKTWLEFRGRTMEQELGSGWAEGIHPEDAEHCLATYYASFDARLSFQVTYRLLRADGEYRWVLDNGVPLYREGEFAGYIGSCIDVTEQKRVEEQLRINQVQLMESQRLAKVASWEVDIATRQTRWSDEWYRIFGLPRDVRPEAETFLRCVHPRDRQAVMEAENTARSTDGPFGVDFRIIRPDGEVRFIRSIVEAIKNENGALVRMTGAAQDVTEQVKATELLRESEARLKSAERMTHVGNWTWVIKTNRVSWSEELFRIMGQPPDYEPGFGEEPLLKFVPADRGRVERWVSDCLAEKKGRLIEVRIIRPSGELRTVVCTAEVLLDEDGSPERMFGACQDVTEARREQDESFARQQLESLGTLASGIAHDFNNLLGAVLAQTELAMAELGPESNANEELKSIRDVAIRGSEVVRQLMIYAGKESDVPEPVDASEVIQGMLELLKVAVSHHAALVTDLGKGLPAVRARAAQLSQIVMNLVVNASEALGDRDGVIRVTTRHVAIGQVEGIPSTLAAGDYVQLGVSDTGCGMSPETQAKIFDPFFTTKFSGRGLGLAVVHGIVRSLHGTIQVASEAGNGTVFQVLLPCTEPVARPEDAPVLRTEESTPPARRVTVLLVEDEEPLRWAVAKMLRKSGWEAVEAASGSAAIDLLRARGGEIDLMLLDLTIPGASSQEVLAEAALARPNVKVVLTSAYSEEVAEPMMHAPVVRGFIRKPFQLAELVRRLLSVLVL